MSQQAIDVLVLTAVASGAVEPNRFVTAGGAQAGADANTLGVAKAKAADGEAVPVAVLGTAVVEAGAAFAVGAPLSSDASGMAQETDGATYTQTVARALEAATAPGDLVEVVLIPN